MDEPDQPNPPERRAIVADGVELPLEDPLVDPDDNIGRKIVSGGGWRIVSYSFMVVLAIVALAIYSREIGPVDFAQLATALSLIAIAMQISDFGLLALGVREYAALGSRERERAFRALISLRLVFSSIAAVGIMLFAVLMDYSDSLIAGLAFASVGLVVFSLQASYTVPLQATYRLNTLAIVDAARQILISTLMVAAAVVTGSVGLIVATNLPVALVMAVVGALLIRGTAPIFPSFDWSAMRRLLGDVGAFAVASSIGLMYAYVAQVVSDAVLNSHESGQFALAFRVYAVMLAGWIVAVSGAFPLLVTSSRDDVERMIYATRRLVQTSLLVGTASLVGLVTGATFVQTVLGGNEFEEAAQLIALIGLAMPATFALVTGSTVLLASGRHRELVAVSIAGAAVSVAITWFAATEWEGVGAALGLVVGEVLIAGSYLVLIHRIAANALPGVRWMLGVAFAGAAGCAVALLGLPSLIAAIFGSGIFLVVGLALRVFPPELTDHIPGHPRR